MSSDVRMSDDEEAGTRNSERRSAVWKCGCPMLSLIHTMYLMLALVLVFFVIELVVGHVTGSNSLVADSFHMLNDFISLVIAVVAVKLSKSNTAKSKKTTKNTYGWARAEVLGSLINGVFLLALCFSIAAEALSKLADPTPLKHVKLVVIVGGCGLIVNVIGLILFSFHGSHHLHSHGDSGDSAKAQNNERTKHGHSHNKNDKKSHSAAGTVNTAFELNNDIESSVNAPTSIGKQGNTSQVSAEGASNMNAHGVYLHVLADTLGSVAVVASGLIIMFVPPFASDEEGSDYPTWKLYVDPVLSLVLSGIIVASAVPLLKESSRVLMQSPPAHIDMDALTGALLGVQNVLGVHELNVWSLSPGQNLASLHLSVSAHELAKQRSVVQQVKSILHANNVHSHTLQLECQQPSAYDVCCKQDPCSKSDVLMIEHSETNNEDKQISL